MKKLYGLIGTKYLRDHDDETKEYSGKTEPAFFYEGSFKEAIERFKNSKFNMIFIKHGGIVTKTEFEEIDINDYSILKIQERCPGMDFKEWFNS